MSCTKLGSTLSGAAMRMLDGDQRVLPPASASCALSINVILTAPRARSAAVSAAASPAAPWPMTTRLGDAALIPLLSNLRPVRTGALLDRRQPCLVVGLVDHLCGQDHLLRQRLGLELAHGGACRGTADLEHVEVDG